MNANKFPLEITHILNNFHYLNINFLEMPTSFYCGMYKTNLNGSVYGLMPCLFVRQPVPQKVSSKFIGIPTTNDKMN